MPPKVSKNVENESEPVENIKAKRGRKSKKDLLASLNMLSLSENVLYSKPATTIHSNSIVSLNINELANKSVDSSDGIMHDDKKECDINLPMEYSNDIIVNSVIDNQEHKYTTKKRGRKPKGGKIIQQIVSLGPTKEDKPNVILHLKCSMKDLQLTNSNESLIESYNFGCKNDLSFDIIGSENISSVNNYMEQTSNISYNLHNNNYDHDNDNEDEIIYKDTNKEIWKKLKQLEHNLHINNVNNKRSACFWDTCEFDNPPIYIPKHFINNTYHVYGCFCSPECGVAYLMNENIDSSTKFERYHLFNHIYAKMYDYKKNIKPAPNPYYMLEKYYGNLSTQEYRALLRNERLFLIVDKPLTRILPELHEDNDDFILNNKIIPSNNYQVKTKLQRRKQTKNSILNEKFGITNTSTGCTVNQDIE
jgi:hypothetical protein